MEPMNQFLNTHRQEFKCFVDNICGISPDRASSAIPPSYATPITILGRLPNTGREGFPSLPYLIDQAKECAALVTLWLDARYDVETDAPMSEELKRFDVLCKQSREKTKHCVSLVEHAQRQSGVSEPRWEGLVEQMERKAKIRAENGRTTPGTPRSADIGTDYSSTSSIGDDYMDRHMSRPASSHRQLSRAAMWRQNERSGAEDTEQSSGDETDTAPISSSAAWDHPGVQGLNERTMSPEIARDTDEDSYEDTTRPSSSSIYSIGANPSNNTATPPSRGSRHSGKHNPNAKSNYVLKIPGSSAERSTGGGRSTSNGTPVSSYRSRNHAGSIGKSMYRLKDVSLADSPSGGGGGGGGGRRSPASRDGSSRDGSTGMLRVGDFGNLFKRKGKEER